MLKFYILIHDEQLSQLVKTSIRKVVPKPHFSKKIDRHMSDVIVVSDHEHCLKEFDEMFHNNDTAKLMLISDTVPPLSLPQVTTFAKADFSYDLFIQEVKHQLKITVSHSSISEEVLSFFKDFSGDDNAFFEEMIKHFENSFKVFDTTFKVAEQENTVNEGVKAVHKFKSSLNSIGANSLIPENQKLENEIRQNGFSQTSSTIFNQLIKSVRLLLKELKNQKK